MRLVIKITYASINHTLKEGEKEVETLAELNECVMRLEAEKAELKDRILALENQMLKNKNKHKVTCSQGHLG